jgi:hypothetical protein
MSSPETLMSWMGSARYVFSREILDPISKASRWFHQMRKNSFVCTFDDGLCSLGCKALIRTRNTSYHHANFNPDARAKLRARPARGPQ